MIYSDLHMHTTFCDGKNTPEEMVVSAIEKGVKTLGFSTHSYTPFDSGYCIKDIDGYKMEINRLKCKYKDDINILLGIEADYYSDVSYDDFDYVIGSVHYVLKNGEYIPVDNTAEILTTACEKHYGGNIYGFIKDYYSLVGEINERINPDIIGHIDLVTKFNENEAMFAENDEYLAYACEAVDKLLKKQNTVFEMNTGAISRKKRTTPYPSIFVLSHIIENGGKITLSSDSHSKDFIGFRFDECIDILRNNNATEITVWNGIEKEQVNI